MTTDLARKGRVRASIVAALIALVAIPAGIAGPVAAAPDSASSPVDKYVALGDSVAAGQGGGDYVDAWLRSPAGYPALLDAQPKVSLLRNAACTGATITDVTANQLGQVNRGTTLVTVTVGANGVDLQRLYAACASGQTPVECGAALNDAATYLNSGQVPAQLGALIAGIDDRSPRATIVVTGYPVPFASGLSAVADSVNQLVELLNTQLALTALTAATPTWTSCGPRSSSERIVSAGRWFRHTSAPIPPTRSRSSTPPRMDTSSTATPFSQPSVEPRAIRETQRQRALLA
jgi:lysophospholipase L1-like esterase